MCARAAGADCTQGEADPAHIASLSSVPRQFKSCSSPPSDEREKGSWGDKKKPNPLGTGTKRGCELGCGVGTGAAYGLLLSLVVSLQPGNSLLSL